MFDPAHHNQDELAALLKAAAAECRPSFSSTFHHQTLHALDRSAEKVALPMPQRSVHSWQYLALGLSAACLMAVVAALYYAALPAPGMQQPREVAVRESESVDELEPSVMDFAAPLAAFSEEGFGELPIEPWADWSHDAELASQLVLDQMPMGLISTDEYGTP